MIDPTEADIGRKVVYTGNTHPGGKLEEGVITSFNSATVFVRYGAKVHSQGTNPQDLEWMFPTRTEMDMAEGRARLEQAIKRRDDERGRPLTDRERLDNLGRALKGTE